MQSVLREQLKNPDMSLIMSMLRDQNDYNADKQRPVSGPYIKRTSRSGEYNRRLEDIDESWVRKYVTDAVTGLKIRKSGGLREYRRSHAETRVIENGEGERVEESDLLLEYGNTSYRPMDVATAKSKLPYLLKRLHDKSVELRTSVLSLIRAYEIASSGGRKPMPKDILAATVYQMGADGTITGKFPGTANSGKVFPKARAWIAGEFPDSYFDDAMELLRVCDVLGIDIRNEDPREFQADTIEKMRVTYISRNREYLSGARSRNHSVLNDLACLSISDYSIHQERKYRETQEIQDVLQAVSDCESNELRHRLECLAPDGDFDLFFRAYAGLVTFRVRKADLISASNTAHRKGIKYAENLLMPVLQDFIVRDGFLYDPGNMAHPRIFHMKVLPGIYPATTDGRVILHISGTAFLITRGNRLRFLDICTLAQYISDAKDGITDSTYGKNHKLGWWDACFV